MKKIICLGLAASFVVTSAFSVCAAESRKEQVSSKNVTLTDAEGKTKTIPEYWTCVPTKLQLKDCLRIIGLKVDAYGALAADINEATGKNDGVIQSMQRAEVKADCEKYSDKGHAEFLDPHADVPTENNYIVKGDSVGSYNAPENTPNLHKAACGEKFEDIKARIVNAKRINPTEMIIRIQWDEIKFADPATKKECISMPFEDYKVTTTSFYANYSNPSAPFFKDAGHDMYACKDELAVEGNVGKYADKSKYDPSSFYFGLFDRSSKELCGFGHAERINRWADSLSYGVGNYDQANDTNFVLNYPNI